MTQASHRILAKIRNVYIIPRKFPVEKQPSHNQVTTKHTSNKQTTSVSVSLTVPALVQTNKHTNKTLSKPTSPVGVIYFESHLIAQEFNLNFETFVIVIHCQWLVLVLVVVL